MYKGRYVAVVEYDFTFDETLPHARPVEHVRGFFRSGEVEKAIKDMLCIDVFDPDMGECEVTQTYFDMHEVPPEEV